MPFQNSYIKLKLHMFKRITKQELCQNQSSIFWQEGCWHTCIFRSFTFQDNKTMWDYARLTACILVKGEWIRTKQQGSKQHTNKPSQQKKNGFCWWWPLKELQKNHQNQFTNEINKSMTQCINVISHQLIKSETLTCKFSSHFPWLILGESDDLYSS